MDERARAIPSDGEASSDGEVVEEARLLPTAAIDAAAVWRYPQMCAHWGVGRATVERWVRCFEEAGEGIPVRRDPSG